MLKLLKSHFSEIFQAISHTEEMIAQLQCIKKHLKSPTIICTLIVIQENDKIIVLHYPIRWNALKQNGRQYFLP